VHSLLKLRVNCSRLAFAREPHIARWLWFAVAAVFVGLSVPACKPRVGSKCEGKQERCLDAKTALRCGDDGKYIGVNCSGAIGCIALGSTVTCDMRDATEGAPCLNVQDGDHVCNETKDGALQCKANTFQRDQECRGAKGCSMLGKVVTCDNTKAEKGDLCHRNDGHACSVDGKSMFICRNGHFEPWRVCRGKDACQVKSYSSEALCDNTISEFGDACGTPSAVACSVDGSQELICRGGRYEVSRACKQGCAVVGARRIECN
jgi:hypothetical protein